MSLQWMGPSMGPSLVKYVEYVEFSAYIEYMKIWKMAVLKRWIHVEYFRVFQNLF